MAVHTLILDGFLGRPRRWERLRRRLLATAGPASIFSYDCTGRLGLPTLGRLLIDRVGMLGGAVNLVGYSMGGLVIRSAKMLEPTLPVEKAVFINSPHRGTWLAHLWPLPGVRQMRPRHPYLRTLNAAPWDVPTLVVYNRFDGIVVPARSTRWPACQDHYVCPVPAHVWPVWSKSVHRRVADFLAAPSKEAACPLK